LTKAANAEVALLEQKQELAKAISNWYGKQVTDCISSADVLMKSNEMINKEAGERISAAKLHIEKCIMTQEQRALKAAEIIDKINEEDRIAHQVLMDVIAGKRSRAELMLMPAKILPRILELKALVGEIGIDMDGVK
jgi:hypothetical protein